MQVTTTSYTIAEYCGQMERGEITVNRDYQRSAQVWPNAAKSYLIDTILLGYPVPKLSLHQTTDLRTRTTTKQIVDGQQRSEAIFEFYTDKLRLSGKIRFSGKRYSQLDEPEQRRFIGYQLTADIFVGATDADIREVFRRINSYMVPLNAQETRHSTYQGEFKWFIVDLTERFSQSLKEMGVFREQQLTRMNDGQLFTDIIVGMLQGITTGTKTNLNEMYDSRDERFSEKDDM